MRLTRGAGVSLMTNKTERNPNDAVDFTIIEELEAGLNDLAVSRRCLSGVLNLSVDGLVSKVASSDQSSVNALVEVAESSFSVIDNMRCYLQCLESGQSRLLNALSKNGHINLNDEVTT